MTRISADITTEQRTGLAYYTIRIALPADEVIRLGEVRLIPGMPVEAFVQTGDRTVMSYLVKPLHDAIGVARQRLVVRHQHQRRPATAPECQQELDDLGAGGGIEVAGRLVGQQ